MSVHTLTLWDNFTRSNTGVAWNGVANPPTTFNFDTGTITTAANGNGVQLIADLVDTGVLTSDVITSVVIHFDWDIVSGDADGGAEFSYAPAIVASIGPFFGSQSGSHSEEVVGWYGGPPITRDVLFELGLGLPHYWTFQIESRYDGVFTPFDLQVIISNFRIVVTDDAATTFTVAPTRGSASGGTVVTLTTAGGFTGATEVLFGGVPASSVVVNSDTSITCVTPVHSVGLVDVEVTGVASVADAYTFVSVVRVSPSGGTTFGGTAVTITGFGFEVATGVTFGGVSATSIVYVSSTTITAVTPAHASGAVDVTVIGVDTLTAGYTYAITQNLLPPIPYSSPMQAEQGHVSNPYFLWLTTLKARVEGLPGNVPAESIIGVLSVNNIPELPFTKILLDTAPRLLGRTTAGAGAAEEIRVAAGLTLSNGLLSLAGLASGYVIGDLLYADSASSLARLADVSAGSYLRSGGVATAPLWSTLKIPNSAASGDILRASGANTYASVAPEALTRVDDTNVTLTLGGTPASALVNATSLTLGWTGTLAVARGGTGTGTAFTTGSVVFAGASGVFSQDNANLFWDDSNDRLGIAASAPATTLDVGGIVTVRQSGTATASFKLQMVNSAGTGYVYARNVAGQVGFVMSAGAGVDTYFWNPDGTFFASNVTAATGTIQGISLVAAGANAAANGNTIKINRGTTAGNTRLEHQLAGTTEWYAGPKGDSTSDYHIESANGGLGPTFHLSHTAGHAMIGTVAFPATGTYGLVFSDGTALASMASNTAGFYANDVGGTVNMFAINEAGTVTQLSGLTSAYTITNVTTDRSYDANATTLDELADTLGTLIADLQARGVCG